jgi:chaperone modulatory protein CbpM
VDDREFCTILKIDAGVCEYWVSRQWVSPASDPGGRRFRDIDVARGQLLLDLERAMGVNAEGIDVIVHLIDQLYGLRMTMNDLVAAIGAQPEDVRRRILAEADRAFAMEDDDRSGR